MKEDNLVHSVTPFICEVHLDPELAEKDNNGNYITYKNGEKRIVQFHIYQFTCLTPILDEEVRTIIKGTKGIKKVIGNNRKHK